MSFRKSASSSSLRSSVSSVSQSNITTTTTTTTVPTHKTVAVGIDLGTYNGRVATYDDALNHPVLVHNRDGHRSTRVEYFGSDDGGGDDNGGDNHNNTNTTTNGTVTHENLKAFVQHKLIQLASDAAHTKDLHIVTSIPNTTTTATDDDNNNYNKEWLEVLQSLGGVITEAAAVCLGYGYMDEEEEDDNNNNNEDDDERNGSTTLVAAGSTNTRTTSTRTARRILVVDGGASALKATILQKIQIGGGGGEGTSAAAAAAVGGGGGGTAVGVGAALWSVQDVQTLKAVNGNTLMGALAESVAQQFEQKHRFPKGEVMQSKKARNKLMAACESGLTTLQIQNTVTIHVDGLYEGMDCQVTIGKPKWDHLSSPLAKQAKTFLSNLLLAAESNNNNNNNNTRNQQPEIDAVLLSGNMHTWLKPIVTSVFPDRVVSSSSIDPAEVIALGCTKQAYLNLVAITSSNNNNNTTTTMAAAAPTMTIPVSPVSIAINQDQRIFDRGTPLPAMATHVLCSSSSSSTSNNGQEESSSSIDIWQMEPIPKQLATLSDLKASSTIRLQLSVQGQLRIWVNGAESLVIG